MKTINTLRYTGNNHTTLVADKKSNPETLNTVLQATALSMDEAEAQLKEQLLSSVEGEDIELIITDIPASKFTKLTTPQLLKLYEKTSEMLGAKEMIENILVKRGAIETPEEEPAEEEETQPVREYKKCMTEECLQARLAEARKNYRKFVKFLCTKDKEEHFGIIRSARLDKRSGFIQYRIEIIERPTEDDTIYTELTGRIYGKGDDSKDLTIFDEKPAEIQLTDHKKEDKESVEEAA